MFDNRNIYLWGGDVWRCFQINEFLQKAGIGIAGVAFDEEDSIPDTIPFDRQLIIPFDVFLEKARGDDAIIIGCDSNPAKEEKKKSYVENNELGDVYVSNYDFHIEYELPYYCEHANQKYEISFEDKMTRWMDSYLAEVEFWNNDVANPQGMYWNHYKDRVSRKDFYCNRVNEIIRPESVILDVGCGICSQYGNVWNNAALDVIGVDPLAAFYNKINKRSFAKYVLGNHFPTVRFGMFELLSYQFGIEYADIIIIDNALDHCIDPVMAIVECLKVLKVGGVLSTFHHVDEAYKAFYSDLHQWNISCDSEGDFIIWNQENYINVTKLLEDYVDFELVVSDKITLEMPFGGVMCNMKKRKSVPQDFYTEDQKERVGIVLEKMMNKLSDTEYAEKVLELLNNHEKELEESVKPELEEKGINDVERYKADYSRVVNSVSYKLGRVITWLPRSIRYGIRRMRK